MIARNYPAAFETASSSAHNPRGRGNSEVFDTAPGRATKIRRLLSTALVSSVAALAALSLSTPAHAGFLMPGGEPSTGSDLRCSTGVVSATLPVAISNTAGVVFEMTSIEVWNVGTKSWVLYAWSPIQLKASVAAGGSSQLNWVNAATNAPAYPTESYRVPMGRWYRLVQYVLVDGAWIYRIPVAATMNSFCFS